MTCLPILKSTVQIIFSLITFLVSCQSGSDFKLSDSQLLLPFNSYTPVNYTLSGSNGSCYKWTSSTPEVATVTAVPVASHQRQDCSQKATVTAVWQSPHRATTTIYARNIVTGHVVKCDIIVDKIHRISIETTTQELYLHNTPEALVVRGYDTFGNSFSTLDGIPFDWRIHGVGAGEKADGYNVLRFITWTESEYATPEKIGQLESHGLQGYMQLVSGLRSGQARVSAAIRDDIYTGVKGGEVQLLVTANAILKPAQVYAIPHARVQYRVYVVQQGSEQEVKMPSTQYRLHINNSNLATLDTSTSIVTALKFGETEIILRDTNVAENLRKPTSLLYIVEPAYLQFTVLPGRRWALQTGRVYTIYIDVYDHNSHRCYPADNLRIEALFPADYFQVLTSSVNGSVHTVKPIREGRALIQASLSEMSDLNGKRLPLGVHVEGRQEADIYAPIIVIPSELVLPWDPRVVSKPLSYLLHAVGGSGEYTWAVVPQSGSASTDESKVVGVSPRGEVIVQGPGEAEVVVADVLNHLNSAVCRVHVVPLARLAFLPGPVEVATSVQQHQEQPVIQLGLAAYDSEGRAITDCHVLPIDFHVEDGTVINILAGLEARHDRNVTEPSLECGRVRVAGSKVGFTVVEAMYTMQQQSVSAKITLAAYRPAQVAHDPRYPHSVIAVGSKRPARVIWGPRPWVLDPSGYFYKVEEPMEWSGKFPPEINRPELLPSDKGVGLRLACREVGQGTVTVAIGNRPTAMNLFPAVSKATLRLTCEIPIRLRLVPQLPLPTGLPPCPIANDTETQQVPIQNTRPLPVTLIFSDREGRQLEAVESLSVRIRITEPSSGPKGASLSSLVANNQPKVEQEDPGDSVSDSVDSQSVRRPFILVVPHDLAQSTGPLQIEALAEGYRVGKESLYSLEARLSLRFNSELSVDPTQMTLYDHAKAESQFVISGGSGYFHLDYDQRRLSLNHPSLPDRSSYRVTPREPGSTEIRVFDRCFHMEGGPKLLTVLVAGLARVQLTVLDRLQLGGQTLAQVRAFDSDDRPIRSIHYPLLNLTVEQITVTLDDSQTPAGSTPASGTATVLSVPVGAAEWEQLPGDETSLLFRVGGRALGTAKLMVHGRLRDGSVVTSNLREIEVFPPLRLDPPDLTLVVGALFQLSTQGGPRASTMIEFHLVADSTQTNKQDRTVVNLVGSSTAGLVRAVAAGRQSVTVRAQAVGPDPLGLAEGGKIVYSQDEGQIRVVRLDSVRIVAPVTTVLVGSTVPLWVAGGLDVHVTPLSLADLQPPLEYLWSLSPPEPTTARLAHLLEEFGVRPNKIHLSSGLRLHALAAGQVTVRLVVKATDTKAGQLKPAAGGGDQLSSQLTLRILHPLSLLVPPRVNQRMLMMPGSRVQVQTSLTDYSRVEYSLFPLTSSVGDTSGITVSSTGLLQASSTCLSSVVPSCSSILQVTAVAGHHGTSSSPASPAGQQLQQSRTPQTTPGVNQSLAVLVQVQPAAYLLLSAADRLPLAGEGRQAPTQTSMMTELPMGGPYPVRVTFHDQLGSQFDVISGVSTLRSRQHRFDHVETSLSPLPLTLTGTGQAAPLRLRVLTAAPNAETVVRVGVHDQQSQLTDYLTIPTGRWNWGLGERAEFTAVVGDRICLVAPYAGGVWSSSNPEVILMGDNSSAQQQTPDIGSGWARGPGLVQLFYTLSGGGGDQVALTRQLRVQPVGEGQARLQSTKAEAGIFTALLLDAQLEPTKLQLITKLQSSSTTQPHSLCSEPLSSVSPLLTCDVDLHLPVQLVTPLSPTDLLNVTSEWDSRTGRHLCVLHPKPRLQMDPNLLSLLASSLPEGSRLDVRARLGSQQHAVVTTPSFSVQLVTGFLVLEPTSASPLVLGRAGQLGSIRLAVSPATRALMRSSGIQLIAQSKRPDLVEVLSPVISTEDGPNPVTVIPVRALSTATSTAPIPDEVEVSIRLALTGQRETVRIGVRGLQFSAASTQGVHPGSDVKSAMAGVWSPWVPLFVTILLAVLAVLIVNVCLRFTLLPTTTTPGMTSGSAIVPSGRTSPQMQATTPGLGGARSGGIPNLWSSGYAFPEPAADFRPISSSPSSAAYRRTPPRLASESLLGAPSRAGSFLLPEIGTVGQ